MYLMSSLNCDFLWKTMFPLKSLSWETLLLWERTCSVVATLSLSNIRSTQGHLVLPVALSEKPAHRHAWGDLI